VVEKGAFGQTDKRRAVAEATMEAAGLWELDGMEWKRGCWTPWRGWEKPAERTVRDVERARRLPGGIGTEENDKEGKNMWIAISRWIKI
jgi:hypothetical protein